VLTTKCTIIIRQDKEYQQAQFIILEGYTFKRMTHFKYLGHPLTKDNDLKIEISTRIYKWVIRAFLVLEKY